MIMMGGFRNAHQSYASAIADAVDLIVQVNRLSGGPRKVTAITEIMGMEQDTIVMQDIFTYIHEGVNENGRATGSLRVDRHWLHIFPASNPTACGCRRSSSANESCSATK